MNVTNGNSRITLALLCLAALLAGNRLASAFQRPVGATLPNFDKRQSQPALNNAIPAAKKAAAERVRGAAPDAQIDFDAVTGAPQRISSTKGFLTGPDGKGLSTVSLAAIPVQDPHRVTKAFIREHRNLFGHGPEALEAAKIKRDYVTPHNGMKTVVWEQQLDDIAVFEATLISHTTRKGELVAVHSTFLGDVVAAADAGTPGRAALQAAPTVSARRAVVLAAAGLGDSVKGDEMTGKKAAQGPEQRQQWQTPGLKGDVDAALTWLPMNAGAMRLCWDITLTSGTRGEMFRVLVDVQTGEVLLRRCLTAYLSDASYRVFTSDSPSPFSPGSSTPLTNQPPLISRTLVTLPALDTNASPSGWIDDGINETRGNNVDAHTDTDNNNSPDLPRPAGSPSRVFDFPMDLTTQDPSAYRNAAVVQLFYVCNWYHDKLYELGFTEAAGNFQSTNFGRGGMGNDAVQADAQDGGGTDNANFSTPPDGSAGRMQMYVFTSMSPRRDGDLDAEIVMHEYTHGLSWRLVGGGQALGNIQSDGMGEGWSDFYGLAFLSEAGDDINGVYAAGAYASYKIGGAGDLQNYYFGIRRYPYATDMSKNPLTFKDIDPAQADYCSSGAPYHTGMFGSCSAGNASEVHNEGEVWCVTLWEARANLIYKYGWAMGNQLILQLVTDGMKLTPAHPNFLQARDAIIQADLVLTGGANRMELWAAFAKRGMGVNATSPSGSTTSGVRESFDLPDDLSIVPSAGFTANGPVGGPFSPNSTTFTLTNTGVAALNWTMINTTAWLNVSLAGGTLSPGVATASVTASLNASAFSLPKGIYSSTVRFTNVNSGVGAGRTFILRVGQPDYFTEMFAGGNNDLAFSTITFVPDGSVSFYGQCREVATSFPTDPTGGNFILLSDDTYTTVTLSGTNSAAIYNRRTNVFFIGSNGYLTFDYGDNVYVESTSRHFSQPRVSALFDDLDPSRGGTISWRELSNRVAVTYQNVPQYGTADQNSFQIEMFFDGRIRLTWLALAARDGLAGLSAGLGVPAGYLDSDLSSYNRCVPTLLVTAPPSATEGAGVLTGQGHVILPAPLTTNLTVALASSDLTEVTVPASLLIPVGQTNQAFDLTIVNDTELDGTQNALITATAVGFGAATTLIAVHDNETAVLHVSLSAMVSEGGGSPQGVVSVSASVAVDVKVNLASSDPSEIQVPLAVVIPAGQTSAVFTATIVDDPLIDATQSATITAHVQNWTDGVATVAVLDNESLQLIVALPASMLENAGTLTNAGTVQLSGALPTNLLISLVSSNAALATVPATITLPAGQVIGRFNITLVDDVLVNGSRPAIINASAPGFVGGSAAMTVLDDESPPVPTNPVPPDLAMNIAVTTDLAWNIGLPGITNEVFFGTNPVPGATELLGSTMGSGWDLPVLAPATTYYWQIVAHKVGTTPSPVWRFTTRGVDHFDWSPIGSPQLVGTPFPVIVTARDEFGSVVSNFTGRVALSGSVGTLGGTNPIVNPSYENGVSGWTTAGIGSYGNRICYGSYGGMPTDGATCWYLFTQNTSLMQTGNYAVARQTVDLTAASSLEFDASLFAPDGWLGRVKGEVRIDGITKWVASDEGLYTDQLIDVTSYSGPHALELRSEVLVGGYYGSQWVMFDNWRVANGQSLITMTPVNSGNFSDGAWSGNVTVLEPATNMSLLAVSESGHRGASTRFDVRNVNDLGVTIADQPDPVAVGASLTTTITVDNPGPAPATGITLTNYLPSSVTFLSATASQGSCLLVNGRVECVLGTLTDGMNATVTVVTTPGVVEQITNRVVIGRAEADGYAANNSAQAVTTVLMPSLSIADTSAWESNAGLKPAAFVVQLFPASPTAVTVSFATADGTAQAGSDYVSTNGVLTFAPGQTNQTVIVQIIGDIEPELDENFFVNLASSGNLVLGRTQAVATIVNVNYEVPGVTAYQGSGYNPALVGTEVTLYANAWGEPFPAIQWQFNGTNLTGATNTYLDLHNVQTNQGGNYFVIASNAVGVATSAVLSLSVIEQPVVYAYFCYSLPPLEAGSYAYLCSQVSLDSPYTLQWRFNGLDLPGQTGNYLYLPIVTPSQVGAYTLVASNVSGAYTSPPAALTIYFEPPSFEYFWFSQGSANALLENDIGFCGIFSGSLSSFQWRFNGTNLPGQTDSCLSLLSITTNQAGPYTLVASNPAGTATSEVQIITVRTQPPVFVSQPYDCTTVEGTDVRFTALAVAGPLATHVLQLNGTNLGVPFSYENGMGGFSLLDVTPADMGSYRVTASNIYGMATSTVAILTVTAAGPLDRWIQRNPLPQSQVIYSVCHGTNQFVAVGDRGTVMTSPDGTNWTVQQRRVDLSLRGVTYAAGLFVAVGYDGTVLSSPDGTNWAYRFSSPYSTLNAVTYGNGRFVSVADPGAQPVVLTSTDGVAWEKSTLPNYRAERGIAFGNGTFVAAGADAILASTNGLDWSVALVSMGIDFENVAFVNGQFIVVGDKGVMLVSSDGASWHSRSVGTTRRLLGVAYGSGQYIAAGVRGILFKSPDAVTWTAVTSGTPDRLQCIDFFDRQFVVLGENGTTITSTNSTAWTKQNSGVTRDLDGMAVAQGTIVVVGKGGSIITSTIGENYTTQNSGVTNDLHGVGWGNGLWVAVGEPGIVLTSTNAVQWTSRATATTNSLKNATWAAGKWVVIGTQGTILTSIDGLNWAVTFTSPNYDLNDVAFGNGLYLVAGDGLNNQNGSLFISSDAVTWTPAYIGIGKNLRGITFTNGQFLITANDGYFMVTSNGFSYSSSYLGLGNLRAATWAQGVWIVVGNGGVITTSPDLQSWTQRATRNVENLHDIVYLNGSLVAIGNRGTILQSAGVALEQGYFTWSQVPSPQITNAPFTVTIQARDFYGKIITNFAGSVTLSGMSAPITPTNSGNFTNGVWSGNIRVLAPATNLVLLAEDAVGQYGMSNPFQVVRSNQPPILLTSPASQLFRAGTNVVLSVGIYGAPTLTYVWRCYGTNLANGGRISGANTAVLTISNCVPADAGSYSVYVYNAFGATTSSNATLAVNTVDHFAWSVIPSPVSMLVPFAVTVEARNSSNQVATEFSGPVALSASVAGSGTPVPLAPAVSGAFVSGVWHGSLSITQIVSNVMLRAEDSLGNSGLSEPFDIVVFAFTVHPINTTNAPGATATLSAAAVSTSSVAYQWRFNSNSIPGATSPSLTITNLDLFAHGGFYDVVASDASSSIRSQPAVLCVTNRVVITSAPVSVTVLEGQTARFTVGAGPIHPILPLTYAWRGKVAGMMITTNTPEWVFTNALLSVSNIAVNVYNAGGQSFYIGNARLTVLSDSDRDGMADAWETANGFATNNAADALLDSDSDGMINRDEYVAGTDPRDSNSVLRISAALTNGALLQFAAQSNISYTVQYRTDLTSAPWQNWSNIGATNSVRLIEIRVPTNEQQFYRIATPVIQ